MDDMGKKFLYELKSLRDIANKFETEFKQDPWPITPKQIEEIGKLVRVVRSMYLNTADR